MRRVLLVAYYFPPMGGAGVTRPLALFRHLPEFGYECHVLTVKPVAYRISEPELLDGLPQEWIYRAGSSDPQRLLYLLGMRTVKDRLIRRSRSVADRFFPDSKVSWVRRAIGLGRDLLANRDYDAIISTSPPISSHLVARTLAREFKRPWLADFRDYWTVQTAEEHYAGQPSRIARARKLMEAVRREAAAVVAVNQTVAAYVGAGESIANCYLDDLAAQWQLPRGEPFVIGVLGALNDVTPISPLLDLLDRLQTSQPALFDRIRLRQVGETDPAWLDAQLDRHGLGKRVDRYGLQAKGRTVDLLSEASLLYVGVNPEAGQGLTTGRIYTMLASGRPILASAPQDSELERLVSSTGNGLAFSTGSEGKAVAYLAGLIATVAEGGSVITPRPSYAEPYSSRQMTARFGALLDRYATPPSR